MTFEIFDHTADLGLRIEAATREELLEEAGRALFTVIAGSLRSIDPRESREFAIAAESDDYLLFDWLSELLALFEAERFLACRFEARGGVSSVEGRAWGEPYDPARHPLEHEVKAVTYHGLVVERIGNRYRAEVIVDI
jgi:SHS2 domain-containing protein